MCAFEVDTSELEFHRSARFDLRNPSPTAEGPTLGRVELRPVFQGRPNGPGVDRAGPRVGNNQGAAPSASAKRSALSCAISIRRLFGIPRDVAPHLFLDIH